MSSHRLPAAVIAAALGQFPPTPEQTAVIESPLEPALVVAGAGSGKTETMASRVVWLVANGMVRRDEVLGLTFTRKAAGELAERIQQRLGRLGEFERRGLIPVLPALADGGRLDPLFELERAAQSDPTSARAARERLLDDLARHGGAEPDRDDGDALLHRPTVSTYNAFADAIVREHALRVGRDPEAAVLSESAAWLLTRRVVLAADDIGLEERPEALRTIVDGALRIARDRLDHDVPLAELSSFGDAFAQVRTLPSESARTTVYRQVEEAASRVGGLPVLAGLAAEYDCEKARRGVIDYADQVAGALAAATEHDIVGEELRQRYRVVLLDEYQDTSVQQTRLLAALFRGEAVMAVGDPHQSIYGWRGASAGNLGGFGAAFGVEGAFGRFSLMTSWRNSRTVLQAANAVLGDLGTGAPIAVGALAPRPEAPDGDVTIDEATDLDAEAEQVAKWFEQLRSARGAEGRSTSGAVLFRSKKHMVRFADALGARGIPHRILGLGGLLSTPEVVDVVSALKVIADPDAGSALIRLLQGPRWAVGLADLRALADLARRVARHDHAMQPLDHEVAARLRASADDDRGSLADALEFLLRQPDDHRWLTAISPQGRERMRDAAGVFAGLRRASNLPVPELIRLVEAELMLDVELAVNETRGPARVASAQLRAFIDEVRGFLTADDTGSLSALLAWLDHAERADELAPRTEPPEEDVVQLLTIHGSKGLEWDAVAVVRLVEDELPTAPRDLRGWLGFGVLPYELRGDRDWLPDLEWRAAATQQALKGAMDGFGDAQRARLLDEERRLAYVAVTRARDHLLLTAAPWSGTKKPRRRSRFLAEIAPAVGVTLAEDDAGEDPYSESRRLLSWPLDPLGGRRAVVESAADRVAKALAATPAPAEQGLALLLAERELRRAAPQPDAPARIPASRFKDYANDYSAAVAAQERPMPERPYRQTRVGTLFHAWVENRSGLTGQGTGSDDALWDGDDPTETTSSAQDEADLSELKRRFERTEWAPLRPIEVETEINFTAETLDGRPHIIVCKLDAVYRRGDRLEIVDWKTGRAPRTEREREEALIQLRLYRDAYHAKHGVPRSEIDVALVYVADESVIRG